MKFGVQVRPKVHHTRGIYRSCTTAWHFFNIEMNFLSAASRTAIIFKVRDIFTEYQLDWHFNSMLGSEIALQL